MQSKHMATATPSTLDRSPSDFSNASIISLGRSTHADLGGSSESTPLLGVSVQTPEVRRLQGIIAIYCAMHVNEIFMLLAVCCVVYCSIFSFFYFENRIISI